jgi:hypothetical protein
MAYTEADLATLQRALVSGSKKVRFSDGREVEYRSLEEIKEIIRMVQEELSGLRKPRVSLAKFTRA